MQTNGKKEKLYVPKQRLKIRFIAALGSYLVWFIMHLFFLTCKKQVFGQDVWDGQMRKNGCKTLGAGWHRGIIYIIFHFRNIDGAIMTSRSEDGELCVQLIKRFGHTSPRGSNTTGGKEALDEFVSLVNSGKP